MENNTHPPQHPGVNPTPEKTPEQTEVAQPQQPNVTPSPAPPAIEQSAQAQAPNPSALNTVPDVSLPGQTVQSKPEPAQSSEDAQPPIAAPQKSPGTPPLQEPQAPKGNHKAEMLVFGLAVVGLLTSLFWGGFIFGVPALVLSAMHLRKNTSSILPKVSIAVSVIAILISVWMTMSVLNTLETYNSPTSIEQLESSEEHKKAAQQVELIPFSSDNATDKKSIVFDIPKSWDQRQPIATSTTAIYRYLDLIKSDKSEAAFLKNGIMYAYNMAGIKESEQIEEQEEYAQNLLANKNDPNTIKNIESLGELKDVNIKTIERYDATGLIGVELLFEAKLAIDDSPVYGKFITAKTAQNIQIMFLFMSSGQDAWIETLPLFDRIEETISFYN